MHLRRIRILTLLERIHPVPAPTETVLTESIVLLPCASVLCGCSSIDRSVVLVRPSSSSSSSPRVAARPGFTWASSPTCSTGSRESASPSPWTHPCGRTRGTRWRQRVSSTQPSHTEQAHPPSRTSTELTSPSALVPVHPSPFSSARCPSRSPAADPGVAGDPPSAVRPREPALEDPPGVSTPSAIKRAVPNRAWGTKIGQPHHRGLSSARAGGGGRPTQAIRGHLLFLSNLPPARWYMGVVSRSFSSLAEYWVSSRSSSVASRGGKLGCNADRVSSRWDASMHNKGVADVLTGRCRVQTFLLLPRTSQTGERSPRWKRQGQMRVSSQSSLD